ncbi:MAG: hypothetical protein HQK58_01885 [Deltaproteobacteria bacterium]|nr:hypothetical protein [Deltaproteobacteria bacterium]
MPIYVLCATCGCLTELADSFWTSRNEFHCRDCGPIFWVKAEKAVARWPQRTKSQPDPTSSGRFAPPIDPDKRGDRFIPGP